MSIALLSDSNKRMSMLSCLMILYAASCLCLTTAFTSISSIRPYLARRTTFEMAPQQQQNSLSTSRRGMVLYMGGGTPSEQRHLTRRDVLIAASVLVGSPFAFSTSNLAWASAKVSDERLIAAPAYDPSNERVFDTRRLSFLAPEPKKLLHVEGVPQVACLGEVHTHPLHHRMQFQMVKAMHEASERDGTPFSIGLEMFWKSHQIALDRFVFESDGDIQRLKYETSWDKTWGYDYNLYNKIFSYARAHKIPLVGLNVPSGLVRLVGQLGIEGLPQKLKDVLPEMDLTQANHLKRFKDSMKGLEAFHGPLPDDVMQRFYEAQTLWEEHMAATASQHIRNAGGRMAIMAGVNHIEERDGLPDRIQRRLGVAPLTVVPQSVDWEADNMPQIESPPGKDFADIIWYTENELRSRRGDSASS